MYVAINWAAAAVLAVSILFYVFIYTVWLKRRTPQNIVIGGAAGAFPPIIGWAAVTGSVDLVPIVLFAIVFFWTPPHFWSLALFAHGDYARAGVPMLPVVAGARETRRQILVYALVLAPIALLPCLIGFSGAIYAVSASLLSLGFIACVWRVWRDRQDSAGNSLSNDAPARLAFKYSIFYLFALFTALAIDRLAGAASAV
jgi:protoheme IX farnesyltransferase